MIKIHHVFLFSLVLMILAGCSKQAADPEQGLPDDAHKAVLSVPFKGMFEVYIYHIINMPPPPPLKQLVHGEGKVTHLGKTKITIDQSWWPPELSGEPGQGYGRIFFSAANGDILLAEYEDGLAYEISPSSVEITFTGYFKDGGNGRFRYASGSFSWTETYNPITNEGNSTVDGLISYGREPF